MTDLSRERPVYERIRIRELDLGPTVTGNGGLEDVRTPLDELAAGRDIRTLIAPDDQGPADEDR